jgi:hypothetical protein
MQEEPDVRENIKARPGSYGVPAFVLPAAPVRCPTPLQGRRSGIEGALLQGGPKIGDPLLDLPQPGRGLRLQAFALGAALPPGAEPHLL